MSIDFSSGKRRQFNYLRFLPLLILVCLLCLTYLLWKNDQRDSLQKLQISFDAKVREITNRIEGRMEAYEQVLRGAKSLQRASLSVNRVVFRDYIATLDLEKTYRGIQGVGFSLLIPREQLTRHIQEIRREGFPEYKLRPEGDREVYSSIIYLEPFSDRNLRAFGYDMFSEPVRRVAMERARDTGAAALSGKVILVQEVGKEVQAGTLMYVPCYRKGMPVETVEQRRAAIYAWVYSPYRMNDLMDGVLEGTLLNAIHIEIFDGMDISAQNILFSKNGSSMAASRKFSQFQAVKIVKVAGRSWSVVIRSLPDFEAPLHSNKEYVLAFSGIAISFLLAFLSYLLLNTRNRAVALARTMTKELHVLNETLTERVAEEVRKNREKDIRLLHNDKLAAIGQLAAGVAHEINNPMSFIMGNLGTLKKYNDVEQEYMIALENALAGCCPGERQKQLAELRHSLDLPFILQDISPLIDESLEGAERIKQIVLDLKDFARTDEGNMTATDLNQCVKSTANIVRNEIKYVADLHLQLNEIPLIVCNPQQINQVIANLLVNASHAIRDHGDITVTSRHEGERVSLSVSDTGCGMTREVQKRIFEPFFTTKDVGKGTGLGLSIAYDIIKKHGGEITLESELDKGTTFTISLPIKKT